MYLKQRRGIGGFKVLRQPSEVLVILSLNINKSSFNISVTYVQFEQKRNRKQAFSFSLRKAFHQ